MATSSEMLVLSLTAASIGTVHTLLGPDHSIPFVAMSRAGNWSARRTLWVTAGCGLGHVAGSVLIGFLGLALGVAVMKLEAFESLRGDTAAWMLIAFGLAYLTWGIVQAVRNLPHAHSHSHADGTVHGHPHPYDAAHRHLHAVDQAEGAAPGAAVASVWTPWLLFLVFVFGPCEPLIPLLMYPAAKASPWAVAAVVAAFTVATVATMTLTVMVMRFGVSFLHLPQLGRFRHAFAGLAILVCGVLVKYGL